MTRHFTLETSLPVSDCVQNLGDKLHLSHRERWHIFYSITAAVHSDDDSFSVVVSEKNTFWGGTRGLFGVTAKGYFEHGNGKTVLHGEIQNLGWKKLWLFYGCIFVAGLLGAITTSHDVLAIFSLVVMACFGIAVYELLSQQFRTMLLDALVECLYAVVR